MIKYSGVRRHRVLKFSSNAKGKMKVRVCGGRQGGEFPGGLVVRIPGIHCCGPGSVPAWTTKILQAKKRKKERKRKKHIYVKIRQICQDINSGCGTSLVVHWVRLCAPSAGGPGFYPWSGN